MFEEFDVGVLNEVADGLERHLATETSNSDSERLEVGRVAPVVGDELAELGVVEVPDVVEVARDGSDIRKQSEEPQKLLETNRLLGKHELEVFEVRKQQVLGQVDVGEVSAVALLARVAVKPDVLGLL